MGFSSSWFLGVQQKKANRTSEKNRKKLSAVSESRLTNDISPESTPGAGRRRARTPHSFPHVKYATQMSVPDQAELDRLRQRINFTDLDEVKHTPRLFIYGEVKLLLCPRCKEETQSGSATMATKIRESFSSLLSVK